MTSPDDWPANLYQQELRLQNVANYSPGTRLRRNKQPDGATNFPSLDRPLVDTAWPLQEQHHRQGLFFNDLRQLKTGLDHEGSTHQCQRQVEQQVIHQQSSLLGESSAALLSLLHNHEPDLYSSEQSSTLPPFEVDSSILQRQTLNALRNFLIARRQEGATGDESLAIEILLRSITGDAETFSDSGSLDERHGTNQNSFGVYDSTQDAAQLFVNVLPGSAGSFQYVHQAIDQERAARKRKQRLSVSSVAVTQEATHGGLVAQPARRSLSGSFDNNSPSGTERPDRVLFQSPPSKSENLTPSTTTTNDSTNLALHTPRLQDSKHNRMSANRNSASLQAEANRNGGLPGWFLTQNEVGEYGSYLSRAFIPPFHISLPRSHQQHSDNNEVHPHNSWSHQLPEEFGFCPPDSEEANNENRRLYYGDDRDRMVYVSWIPKKARAYTAGDKRKMELDLKRRLREDLELVGLCKVLLFPPKGVHCKLIFDSRQSASLFMQSYGGDNGSKESETWKENLCRAYEIHMNEKFSKTLVKIEWSQK